MAPIGTSFKVITSAREDDVSLSWDTTLDSETAEAVVYEDTTGDGTADNIESVTLTDGVGSEELSSFTGSGDHWIEIDGGDADETTAYSVSSISVDGKSWDSTDSFRDSSGIATDSVLDHDGTIQHGYSYESPQSTLYNNLVAYWPLQESNGQANDLSGSGNHGTVNGATQGVAGVGGLTAYSFDGSDDEVDITGVPENGAYTVSFWSRYNSTSGGNNEYNMYLRENLDLQMINEGDGTFTTYHQDSGGTNHAVSTTIPESEWVHLTATWNGSTVELFKNGQSESTTPVSSINGVGSGDFIGSAGASSFHNGEMCDVRVYNRVLSTSEVSTLYDWGSGDYAADKTDGVSRYPLDGNANDVWGTNDGTVNGTTFVSDAIRGQSGEFQRSNSDYISIGSDPLQDDGTFTYSAWIKTPNNTSAQTVVVESDSDGFRQTILLVNSSGNSSAWHVDGSNTQTNITGNLVAVGEWIHLTFTSDGNTIRLYENGTIVTEDSVSGGGPSQSEADIGRRRDGLNSHTDHFDGNIDDVRLYDYALEPHEVHELYQWGTFGRDMRDHTTRL